MSAQLEVFFRERGRPRRRIPTPVRRFLLKHRVALASIALVNLVLFFPLLFMGRVLSPNDIFFNYDPWASSKSVEVQNPVLNAPASSYAPLAALVKRDPAALIWNRHSGAGVAGALLAQQPSPLASPFIFLPALLLPLAGFFSGVVFLKLNVAFFAAYRWLRHERTGRRGAAAGALVFAAAGSSVVTWLWPSTNAVVLYPFVLAAAVRLVRGSRNGVVAVAILTASLLVSGATAEVTAIVAVVLLYVIFLSLRLRRLPAVSGIARVFGGVALGAMLVAPFVFTNPARADARQPFTTFPLRNLRLFLDPFAVADPLTHRSVLSDAVGDNLVTASVYVGTLTLILSLAGLFARRLRTRWFWAGLAAALLFLLFVPTGAGLAWSRLPGARTAPFTTLRVLLPLPFALLTAGGMITLARMMRNRATARMVLGLALAAIALELAYDAARFYPYLDVETAGIPRTASIEFLQRPMRPFRIAPTFSDLWPDSATLFGLEDIRLRSGPEGRYAAVMQRIDPAVWQDGNPVLQFNTLSMNLDDPLVALLNVRYVLEPSSIEILRWKIEDRTQMKGAATSTAVLPPRVERTIEIDVERDGIRSIVLNAGVAGGGDLAVVRAELTRPEDGTTVGSTTMRAAQLRESGKLFIPIRALVHRGEHLLLSVQSNAATLRLPVTGAGEIVYGTVTHPLIPAASFADGRIFENVAAQPRYFAVWNIVGMTFEQMIDRRELDFRETAVVETPLAAARSLSAVAPESRRVRFTIERYDASAESIRTTSEVPFFFVASEKWDRDLEMRIDGRRVAAVRTDGLFVGVPVEKGEHRIEIERPARLGHLPVAAAAAGLLVAVGLSDRRRGARR